MDSAQTAVPPPSSHPGTLHFIPPNLTAFQPCTNKLLPTAATTLASKVLIWIGGMSDTPLSVSYPSTIALALDASWSLLTVSLSSVGLGWGVGSIAHDADDIARIVAFVRARRSDARVVLMGHSTGCQDCIEYVTGRNAGVDRPPVQGIILQAPVSDRQALQSTLPAHFLDNVNQRALEMCRNGSGKDCLPQSMTGPAFGRLGLTAKRWVDVASPGPLNDGADDFFSSDLSDERLDSSFGKVPPSTPLLVLFSGADDSVPLTVDSGLLVDRWMQAVERGGGVVDRRHSGVIAGASHNLNGQGYGVVQDLVSRVTGFMSLLGKGKFAQSFIRESDLTSM